MLAAAIVFADAHLETMDELTRRRTVASIPFGGRYRLIDFALSNLVNSSDFTLFIKDEELLSSLYNLNNNLKKFENGQHDGDLIETIKNDINNVLKFIN